MLSNFIANVPMAWLNLNLNPYLITMGIIPESQIANHNGLQARDVISLLSSIACWARRNGTTVFMTKRDQMKGFDFLSPEGFHDAIRAYGLPTSIIDLDIASQANISCRARTAYGLTEPFVINGLTKQGGNLSPTKCVLTTSMLNWWLKDRSESDPTALIIRSHNEQANMPHTPLDKIRQTISLTEAMDDTILFNTTIATLRRDVYASEHFMLAYSWRTSWEKSSISVFGPCEQIPDEIVVQSVSPDNKDLPLSITDHSVKVYRNEIEYLRTKVDDPIARAFEIRSIVQRFQFPRFIVKTPITLARKIIQQTLVSKIRAKLMLQPILAKDAEEIDRMISNKIHELQGFPYNPSPILLQLPFDLNGFGFPSVSRLNAAIAAQGLERDLNHPIALYRNIAQITLADWQCQLNKCESPIAINKVNARTAEKSRMLGKIPTLFLVGANVIKNMNLSLKATDLNYVTRGEVSIRHLRNVAISRGMPIMEARTTTYLEQQGLTLVNDVGIWCIKSGSHIEFDLRKDTVQTARTKAHIVNRKKLTDWLLELDLIELFQTADAELFIERDTRRLKAESLINALLDVRHQSNKDLPVSPTEWGSDGSQTPSAVHVTENRSTFATSIGPRCLTLQLQGNGSGILQGEVMGMIISTLDALNSPQITHPICNTDHLFTVNLIKDYKTSPSSVGKRLSFANARSSYRWLMSIIERWNENGTTRHVKGHTRGNSTPAVLNRMADKEASSGIKNKHLINYAPIPTFFMNEYTIFNEDIGWFEGNLRILIEDLINREMLRLFRLSSYRLPGSTHSDQRNPDHMYKTATSAYSAVVQLYARSGQLPVRLLMATREDKRRRVPEITTKCIKVRCAFNFCHGIEGVIHLFYGCNGTRSIREEYREALKITLASKCEDLDLDEMSKAELMRLCDTYFFDPSEKGINYALYYLGIVPKLDIIEYRLIRRNVETAKRRKILHSIHSEFHNAGVRLTGRIWGG